MASTHPARESKPRRKATLRPTRFWPVAVVVAFVCSLGVALEFLFSYPLGPVEHVTGTVLNLGVSSGRYSVSHWAFVDLGDRRGTVTLPTPNSCAIGSRIHLWKRRRL